MGFSRQEYWSGVPFPFPREVPNPGIVPASPALAGGFFTTEPPGKHTFLYIALPVHITEKAMAPHSSTLAWRTPWMEEPGGLQSMGSLSVGHD